MRTYLASLLALPLCGCLIVDERAPNSERSDVRVERTVVDDAAGSIEAPRTYLRSVRVPATDVPAIAEFYKRALGMHEIRRLGTGASTQIILNTGSTVEAAAANPHSPIVIVTRPQGLEVGLLAALIMNVPDVDAAIASVVAVGGTVVRPKMSITGGPTFGFVKDPEGNQLELILAD